ncbi:MAG: LysR family transcriptional regulator [Ruminococcus sp.]|nr:LysR family transcriptional regulator [Ruminococcus sp.]
MELTQIRYFLEVAKTQHITKSAEKLHIAQPALTQAIHRLEKDLRVPLFVSKGRNIMLTEYGKYLQKKLEPLMDEFDSIPNQLQTMAKLESDTIHLNVLAASKIVTEAIIEYKKIHDEVNFQFMQSTEGQLYDIGVTTHLFYQLPEENPENIFGCTEKIFLAVPNTHRFAKMTSVRLADVKDEGFISLMGSRQLRWICDRYCRHAGFEPRIIFESDSPAAVRNMIAANIGIGFWPEFTWGEIGTDKVVLLDISDPICRRDIIIDYKQNKIDSGVVVDFFDFLKDYFISAQKEA